MEYTYELPAGNFTHAGRASSEIKSVLKQLNISSKIIKRVVVALYEAEVNVTAHSLGGKAECFIEPDRITMLVSNDGPGIPDIDLAMSEGYSTASSAVREMGFGAGMGLPNIRKNTDEFTITSAPGSSTIISMTVYFTGDDT